MCRPRELTRAQDPHVQGTPIPAPAGTTIRSPTWLRQPTEEMPPGPCHGSDNDPETIGTSLAPPKPVPLPWNKPPTPRVDMAAHLAEDSTRTTCSRERSSSWPSPCSPWGFCGRRCRRGLANNAVPSRANMRSRSRRVVARSSARWCAGRHRTTAAAKRSRPIRIRRARSRQPRPLLPARPFSRSRRESSALRMGRSAV